MKKYMKFGVALAICATFLCGNTLKVGTAQDEYYPFEYLNDHMEIVGFDIDLVKEIAKRSGVDIKIVARSFDKLLPGVMDGKFDFVIAGIDITDERREKFDFTNSYFQNEIWYIKRKATTSITDRTSLVGKKIGVQTGTLQEQKAKEISGAKVISFDNKKEYVKQLEDGQLDAVIMDSAVASLMLKSHNELVVFDVDPSDNSGYAMIFAKDKHQDVIAKFNAALDEMKADGTLNSLMQKYNLN